MASTCATLDFCQDGRIAFEGAWDPNVIKICTDINCTMQLLMATNVFPRVRTCNGCNGRLIAKQSSKGQHDSKYGKHAGWRYICQGTCAYKYKRITIDSMFRNHNMQLTEYMKIIFMYCKVEQRVCGLSVC